MDGFLLNSFLEKVFLLGRLLINRRENKVTAGIIGRARITLDASGKAVFVDFFNQGCAL